MQSIIRNKILPSLEKKGSNELLKELLICSKNYDNMVIDLNYFFSYLERYHIPQNMLVELKGVADACFEKLVVDNYNQGVRDKGRNIGIDVMKDIIELYDHGHWDFSLECIKNYFRVEWSLYTTGDGLSLTLDIVKCWANFTDLNSWGAQNLKSTTVYDMNKANTEVESEVLDSKGQSFLRLGPYIGLMMRQKHAPAKRRKLRES